MSLCVCFRLSLPPDAVERTLRLDKPRLAILESSVRGKTRLLTPQRKPPRGEVTGIKCCRGHFGLVRWVSSRTDSKNRTISPHLENHRNGTNDKVIKQEWGGEGLSFVKARLSRRVLQANCLETREKGPSSPTAFYVRLPVLIHVSITSILWSVLQRVFAQLYLEIAVRIKNLCV
ncbi:hypothetical protein LZ32DRAFT_442947 [Colletotrichum eremochloae]|nr:hypothetical protein LZ32DRAFT_442947 [Colletotrichum eremochloae]